MAGDWIKMRRSLPTCPKVAVLCRITKLDAYAVCGRLLALWSWADEHTEDGTAPGIDGDYLDTIVNRKGFAEALTHEHVGWLEIKSDCVVFPDYEKHNGATGKRRAQDAKRKGEKRKTSPPTADKRPKPVPNVSASEADTTRNRKEKRREEENQPPPAPAVGGQSGAATAAALVKIGVSKRKAEELASGHTAAEVDMAAAIWRDDTGSDRKRLGLIVSMLTDGTARTKLHEKTARSLNAIRRSKPDEFADLCGRYKAATGHDAPEPGQDCTAFYDFASLEFRRTT